MICHFLTFVVDPDSFRVDPNFEGLADQLDRDRVLVGLVPDGALSVYREVSQESVIV